MPENINKCDNDDKGKKSYGHFFWEGIVAIELLFTIWDIASENIKETEIAWIFTLAIVLIFVLGMLMNKYEVLTGFQSSVDAFLDFLLPKNRNLLFGTLAVLIIVWSPIIKRKSANIFADKHEFKFDVTLDNVPDGWNNPISVRLQDKNQERLDSTTIFGDSIFVMTTIEPRPFNICFIQGYNAPCCFPVTSKETRTITLKKKCLNNNEY